MLPVKRDVDIGLSVLVQKPEEDGFLLGRDDAIDDPPLFHTFKKRLVVEKEAAVSVRLAGIVPER